MFRYKSRYKARKLAYVGVLLAMWIVNPVAAQTVKVCADVNFWYPFTMVEEGKAVGIHIDVVKLALSRLGYQAEFKALPWKRCLHNAERGKVDAIATASYKPDRAVYMYYPEDAPHKLKSDYRVTQVEYVVVTIAGDPYEFNGDVTSLPQPVRAPRGYSIVSDLQAKGVKVDSEAAGDEFNIKKLLRDGKGCVVTIPEVVRQLESRPAYRGKFKISEVPVKSKSYYFPFSKRTQFTQDQIRAIWEEIKKIRDDEALMAEIAAKY